MHQNGYTSMEQHRLKQVLKNALEVARTRLLIAAAVFMFMVIMVAGRLVDLTILRQGGEVALVDQTVSRNFSTGRANIIDRNGQVLATTITTASLFANAKLVDNPEQAARKLMTVLPALRYENILKRLKSDKNFIWIARHLTPKQKEQILRLGVPGLNFIHDQKRIYPQGSLVSHIVGFTNVDGQGIAGVENSLDGELSSGNEPVALSVDLRIQHLVRDELLKGMEEFQAVGAAGMVMDVKTGEIIAMVSLPDFNPNHPALEPKESLFNKLTLGTYEMGSTMKIATVAMALEMGIAKLETIFDVTQPLRVGSFRITDIHPKGRPLTVAEIFIHSSNIGMAQLALSAGITRQKDFLRKLGYLDPLKIELKEMGTPIIPKRWREGNSITISYGYGLSITPLHLVRSICSIAGGGLKVQPTLKKVEGLVPRGERIVSESTSKKVLQLMRYVVSEGTAKKANVPEYFVGGKTGSRYLLLGKRYSKDRVATSFVGVVGESVESPRYVIFVMLEDPKASKKTYGHNAAGWNAAAVFGHIVARMGPILNLKPNPLKDTHAVDPFFHHASFGSHHASH